MGPKVVSGTALGGMISTDVPDDAVLLVPVGTTEQHGPHPPLDTHTGELFQAGQRRVAHR